ncbi:hypothetical protein D0C16_05555 [Cellvibrio sp. KY-GH-1]|uniref:hypothetical protein n=1 Tax=Cellvibrio sp. KY-GH-1 TaxID=2303332 RepID=UPI00124520B8|nr:hypothetical protein [Cellvibrio sp. KY-GH-1]QEY15486.1 hypothetical protein D0C16_05555 [Cellvibrio sp. KY-GH-1]
MKDFTPTKETISLHGLGFIQLKLGGNQRLHVWHPDLPRRKCFDFSAIHNHRFSFTSRVLKGVQKNMRVDIELAKGGSHQVISHNGPRSERGGRASYPVAECNIYRRDAEEYCAGERYVMPAYEYHCTPCDGIVITLMQKHEEGQVHANSLIVSGVDFDYDFDRFQLSPAQLYEFVVDAFNS